MSIDEFYNSTLGDIIDFINARMDAKKEALYYQRLNTFYMVNVHLSKPMYHPSKLYPLPGDEMQNDPRNEDPFSEENNKLFENLTIE
jgi:hypothetical protein